MVSIIILWDHLRICGPSLTETSLCGAYLYPADGSSAFFRNMSTYSPNTWCLTHARGHRPQSSPPNTPSTHLSRGCLSGATVYRRPCTVVSEKNAFTYAAVTVGHFVRLVCCRTSVAVGRRRWILCLRWFHDRAIGLRHLLNDL